MPAFISGLVSRKGKRLGDYLAGTYVVREPGQARPATPPDDAAAAGRLGQERRHRAVAGAAAALGASGARPDRHAGAADPVALLDRLAEEISAYVAPPPPYGTPAEAYLAAVIAEHRDRDLARMQREAALVGRLTAAARQRT